MWLMASSSHISCEQDFIGGLWCGLTPESCDHLLRIDVQHFPVFLWLQLKPKSSRSVQVNYIYIFLDPMIYPMVCLDFRHSNCHKLVVNPNKNLGAEATWHPHVISTDSRKISNEFTTIQNWLVIFTILKNMKVNGKDYPIYEMENSKNVWNH